jgi:hypothetical protein
MRWTSERIPLLTVLFAAALLGCRELLLIRRYSVNVLYLDQWDFYTPLFQKMPLTDFFLWQVGPVRQGLGSLLSKYVAELSGWDARAESLSIATVVFVAMLFALYLKRRLLASFTLLDVSIPLIFLSPVMTGLYTIVPNPSHGAFPLLLTILYCIAWTYEGQIKYVLVSVINFLMVFTGFGLLMGFITPVILVLDGLRALGGGERRRAACAALALLAAFASLILFSLNYEFQPGVECFQFLDQHPSDYFRFASLMFAGYLRLGGHGFWPTFIGASCTLLMAAVFIHHVWLLLGEAAPLRHSNLVISILIGYSLLFSLTVALGRTCLGFDSAPAARYMPYLIPAYLALYFHFLLPGRKMRLARMAPYVYFLILLLTSSPLGPSGTAMLEYYRRSKSAWKECYLELENVEECNRTTGFEIHPAPAATSLQEKLSYLKQNRRNLYAGN